MQQTTNFIDMAHKEFYGKIKQEIYWLLSDTVVVNILQLKYCRNLFTLEQIMVLNININTNSLDQNFLRFKTVQCSLYLTCFDIPYFTRRYSTTHAHRWFQNL